MEGGPIVRFTNSDGIDIPEGAELLGRSETNSVLISYRRDSVRFLTEDQDTGNEISKVQNSNQSAQEKS